MNKLTSTLLSRRILAVCFTVLLVLSFIPVSDGTLLESAIGKAGVGQVNTSARTYLQEQREQALKGFLVLSALKVGLAVLKSSEIGLILNVRIGDLAVAVYDYVNFAWKVLLAAVAWFYLADFFLDLSGKIDIWFLWTALLCFSIVGWFALFQRPGGILRNLLFRTGAVAAVLSIVLYLALPLGLVGAGWVSANITGTAIEDANSFMESLQDDMPTLLESENEDSSTANSIRTPSVTVPFPYDGTDPLAAIVEDEEQKGRLSRFAAGLVPVEKVRDFGKYLESKSKALASVVIRQTAAYLFNIVLLPLFMVVSIYLGAKYALSFVPARTSLALPGLDNSISQLVHTVRRLEKGMGKAGTGERTSPNSHAQSPKGTDD
jgi:hypothetical protein